MILLKHIHKKCKAGYKLNRLQEKINHLMYMDDIKLFAKNEKKKMKTLIHTARIYSQGRRNRIWHRKMCHASNEKWQTTSNCWNGNNKPTQG